MFRAQRMRRRLWITLVTAAASQLFPLSLGSPTWVTLRAQPQTSPEIPQAEEDSRFTSASIPSFSWYPGCAADLDLPPVVEPDPNSQRSQKFRERKAQYKADKAKFKAAKRAAAAAKRAAAGTPFPQAKPKSAATDPELEKQKVAVRKSELEDFLGRSAEGPTVCVDCEWEPAMSRRELASVVQTLSRCYGRNKVAERPFRLVFSGIRTGSLTAELIGQLNGIEKWGPRVEMLEEPYIRHFPKERLVYLSPEGEEVADTFDDKERVYIMGALNDSGRLPGKSRLKADLQGIPTLRLPLEDFTKKGKGRMLVPDQVFNIMLDRRHGRSWKEALLKWVPGRKLDLDRDR